MPHTLFCRRERRPLRVYVWCQRESDLHVDLMRLRRGGTEYSLTNVSKVKEQHSAHFAHTMSYIRAQHHSIYMNLSSVEDHAPHASIAHDDRV